MGTWYPAMSFKRAGDPGRASGHWKEGWGHGRLGFMDRCLNYVVKEKGALEELRTF